MQVFIVGSPLETAMALDSKRLNRQIQETKVILDALNGAKVWSNHPCVLQYRGCEAWLKNYMSCLQLYSKGHIHLAEIDSNYANLIRPDWHDEAFYSQHKRRLYTKDKEHYKQWADLGESDCNWYFVDNEWRKYVNSKRVE